jgi:flavin-dependent thymidylate synthase
MMQVTLIDYTGHGTPDPGRRAANILVFTKSTRLQMAPSLMEDIENMEFPEIVFNLRLMADTNPGSWEFVHLTFLMENVTRAFTHQLVRTRTSSYAQQTMRIINMSDFKYRTGPSIDNKPVMSGEYQDTMKNVAHTYKLMVDNGVDIEDARGILPTDILTNITMSINFRNFVNLVRKRSSGRVGSEYRQVLDQMVIAVEKIYPWAYLFIKNDELKARKDLQDMIYDSKLDDTTKTAMVKKLDMIMKDL